MRAFDSSMQHACRAHHHRDHRHTRMNTAQRTSSQVRGQPAPVSLEASIDALHEGAQLCLPLCCGQVVLEGGLCTLDAACSIFPCHLVSLSGVKAVEQRELLAADIALV